MKTPFVLAIIDGWGINKEYNGNAITQAKTPVYDSLWKDYPHTELCAHGKCVGLPSTQDGNSEAGHMNLGAGRAVNQDTVIVSRAINSGVFFKNPAFKQTIDHVKGHNSSIHLVGLLSGWQSAHSDPDHVLALLTFYRQQKIKNVYLHLFTDGRDSFKYGAKDFLGKLKKEMKNGEKIATVSGRYYAMDRKKKWDRTEKTYDALTLGKANFYARSASEAMQQAYERGETDEFIAPTVIVEEAKCDKKGICTGGTPVAKIKSNDAVVFFNLRSDRIRELTKAFVQKDFNKKNPGSFGRKKILKNLVFVAMTDFGPDLGNVLSAFPSSDLKRTLPMELSDLRQLYISENEKYAHITYFFNGGYADPVGNEDRIMIASPDVAGYDQKPEMSTLEITNVVLENLKKEKYDFVAINFANPDMVGHTGNLAAGIQACESVDKSLKKLLGEIKNKKGVLIVTADHGNAEEMINEETGEVDTQHSNYKVPFILVDEREESKNKKCVLKKNKALSNVAPTILDLMNKKIPKEMDESLII